VENEKNDEFENFCVTKIDEYLSEQGIKPKVKRKYRETSTISGTIYKFPHFGVEISEDQVLIFGRYKSQYFDAENYASTEKLTDELLPTIIKYYNNPIMTRHPIIRFFCRSPK